jgi:hypothetical protein
MRRSQGRRIVERLDDRRREGEATDLRQIFVGQLSQADAPALTDRVGHLHSIGSRARDAGG